MSQKFFKDNDSPKVKRYLASGHVWKETEDGFVDIFVESDGDHNGPGCVNCGQTFCWHCEPKPGRCSKPKNVCDNCATDYNDHDLSGCSEFHPSPPAEPKCERCGHDADNHHNGKDCLWDNAEGEDDLIVCRCESYRPPTTEPAQSEGKEIDMSEQCHYCDSPYAKLCNGDHVLIPRFEYREYKTIQDSWVRMSTQLSRERLDKTRALNQIARECHEVEKVVREELGRLLNGRWIPITTFEEFQKHEYGRYWVTRKDGRVEKKYVNFRDVEDFEWMQRTCLAFMPIQEPRPYTPEGGK